MWGEKRISIGLNIENLFDQMIVTRRHTTKYRDGFNVTDQVFFSGAFDPTALATAAPNTYRPDPRYGLPDQWQPRREMRLQVRYSF